MSVCEIYKNMNLSSFTDISQLSNRRGDDAVQRYGQ